MINVQERDFLKKLESLIKEYNVIFFDGQYSFGAITDAAKIHFDRKTKSLETTKQLPSVSVRDL